MKLKDTGMNVSPSSQARRIKEIPKKQKPYFEELVDLAQVDPFFGIQFVDITHVPIH